MASEAEHCAEDRAFLGKEFPEVHQLLDQFAHFPDMKFLTRHRKFLHHYEGIAYVRMRWGDEARKSAEQHVIRDCGHIPYAIDYYDGSVDNFGILQ
jgi:hypothetical protein